MAVKPVISVSKKATKLMLYVYLCECGGGPGHSGTKPKGKRREERRRENCQRLWKRCSIQLWITILWVFFSLMTSLHPFIKFCARPHVMVGSLTNIIEIPMIFLYFVSMTHQSISFFNKLNCNVKRPVSIWKQWNLHVNIPATDDTHLDND